MNNDYQNFAREKVNSDTNTLIEMSMTAVFIAIIIFSCLVIFGS